MHRFQSSALFSAGKGMQAVVSMAQEVQASRSAARSLGHPSVQKQYHADGPAPTNGKHVPGVANGGIQKPKKGKKVKRLSAKQQQGIALAAALEAKAQRKKAKKRSKLVVMPRAGGA